MKRTWNHGLRQAGVLVVLILGGLAWAESPALLLEQGIYAEQTEGDLDKAIGLYQRIIDDVRAQQSIVGHAHLRIGLCLLKSGKTEAGARELQTVLDDFPGDPALVAQTNAAAREHGLSLEAADSPVIQWQKKLESCTNHKQAAFSVGPMMLDSLSPDEAWHAVMAAWPRLQNDDVKTGISKAFAFRNHPRVLDVLDLGMRDASMGVKSYVKGYVGWYAFRDFAENYDAYDAWYSGVAGKTLQDAQLQSLRETLAELTGTDTAEQLRRLTLLVDGIGQYAPPETKQVLKQELFDRALDAAAQPVAHEQPDVERQKTELRSAHIHLLESMDLTEAQMKQHILPLLEAHPDSGLLSVFSGPEHAWALDTLLEMLMDSVAAKDRGQIWAVARALERVRSYRAIPPMIAAINADNTYDTVYGVGYFGLGKMTGVTYDESHDGAWWIAWWEKNKDQFNLSDEQEQIPEITVASQPSPPEASEAAAPWVLVGADPQSYAMEMTTDVRHEGEEAQSLKSVAEQPKGFGTTLRKVFAGEYAGHRVRMHASIKSDALSDWVGMWLRVDSPDGGPLAFDNMEDRPIKGTTDWTAYNIVLDVPENAEFLVYGVLMNGTGQVWMRGLAFDVVSEDVARTDKSTEPAPGEWFLAGQDPRSYEMGEETAAPHAKLETRYLKSISTPRGFATMMANAPAAEYRGKRCQLAAQVKAQDVAHWAGLWVRVDGPDNKPLAFDNMQDRPIKGSQDWQEVSVVLEVPETAENIAYGLLMDGEGQVWTAGLNLAEAPIDTPVTGAPIE